MTPSANLASAASPPSELKETLQYLTRPFRRAAFFSLFVNLMVLAPTLYMLEVYDRVLNSRSMTTLLMLTGVVLLAYAVMEGLDWVRLDLLQRAALQFDDRLNTRVLEAAFDARLGGSASSMRAVSDLRTVRDFIASSTLLALIDTPLALSFLLLVFLAHPLLGLISFLLAATQILTAWLSERRVGDTIARAGRGAEEAQQYAHNCLRNAEVIEAMGMLGSIRQRWVGKQRAFLALQANASDLAGLSRSSAKFFQLLQGSALLGLGVWLMLEGVMQSTGTMIVVSVLGGRAVAPLVQAITQWRQVAMARNAYTRLDELLRVVPTRAAGMKLPPPSGALSVEGVVAIPPGSRMQVIRGVSFALPAGTSLAVVGPSACGKSSLAKLMVGVWPAAAGKVRLDSADIHSWSKAELGPYVGYLPQEVELFDGTLAENIARFGEMDMQKVEEAARLAGVHEFILSLPEGYATPIGEDGRMLSGGQRQRVGLARALYGNPRLVVLDEPNSNLDDAGERALVTTLQRLKAQGATVVVITHRPGILQAIERVALMRDGALVKFGARDEVLAPQPPSTLPARPAVAMQAPAGGV